MAYTLLQYAIDNRVDRPQGALIMMLDKISPVFRLMPMDKIDGMIYDYERVATLPSVMWRELNQGYAESSGDTTPFREYAKILGGEVKIDVAFLRSSSDNGARLKQRQIKMKLLAAANEWERAFFEGSELNSAAEMVGLRARLTGNQLIQMASGGGTLTLAGVDALIDSVPFESSRGGFGEGAIKRGDGITKALFMNRTLYTKLDTLIKATTGSRLIETSLDDFGNRIQIYRGCILNIVEQTGQGGSAGTTLWFDEDPGDGVSDTASIYCVAFGDELTHGFYNNGNDARGMPILMAVKQFGDPAMGIEAEPRLLIRFESQLGMAIDHPRAAGRLYAITNT